MIKHIKQVNEFLPELPDNPFIACSRVEKAALANISAYLSQGKFSILHSA
jgi:hypothetical protein